VGSCLPTSQYPCLILCFAHGMLGSPRRWGLLNSRDSLVCTVRSTVRALKATVKVYETSGASPAVSNIGLVTLTTQCSLDRWPKFQQQAESWGGPVSVAVYIPAPQHTPAADAAVSVLQNWAADHADHHPHQQLQVVALFAGHYAREGASVLVEQGTSRVPPGTLLQARTALVPFVLVFWVVIGWRDLAWSG
jgi:hypothetical protein